MGLDITVYRGISKVECSEEDCSDGGHGRLYVNTHFVERADGLTDGCYAFEKEWTFRAGSYSGYSEWREGLAKLAGYPAVEKKSPPSLLLGSRWLHAAACWQGATGPFSELINFSDCEGVIGPETSKKLLADFDAFDDRAKKALDEYGYGKYRDWRKAFELAAHGGAVQFH